jgi:hypothetical protein
MHYRLYAKPFVDVGSWREEDIAVMLGTRFASWIDWKEEALVLQAPGASQRAVTTVRTAVKMSKRLPRLFDDDEDETSSKHDETEQAGDAKSSATQPAVWLSLLKKGSKLPADEQFGPSIVSKVNLLQDSLISLEEGTTRQLKALQVGLGIRLNQLELQMGSYPSDEELRSQLVGASIWNVLEDVQTQLEEVKGSEHVKLLADKVWHLEGFNKHTENVKGAFKMVMQRILPVESKLQEMESKHLAEGKRDGLSWLGIPSNKDSQDLNVNIPTADDKAQSLIDRVTNLELTMNPGHGSDGEDISVSFMGVRFSSEQDDVKSYVESLSGGKFSITAGLMSDCYAVFHALNREIFNTKNKLSMIDLAKVASLGTKQMDVYHMLAAAEHGLPEFFDSSPSGKVFIDGKQGKKNRFNNLASYEIWGPVGTINDAVRRKAEVQLARFVKTKRIAIQELANPELVNFLNAMLNASKEFVEAVFSFLTEEYAALAEYFSDGVLCWDFACSCVEHVFKYEFEAA